MGGGETKYAGFGGLILHGKGTGEEKGVCKSAEKIAVFGDSREQRRGGG